MSCPSTQLFQQAASDLRLLFMGHAADQPRRSADRYSEALRIVMISPYPPKRDGIGIHTAEIIAALPDTVDAHVLTASHRDASPEPTVHRVAHGNPAAGLQAWRALRELRPDVIHVQFAVSLFDVAFLASLVAAAIAKRAFGTRVVTTSHEVLRELELLGPAGRLLHHWIGRLSDEVVVYTDESRDLLIRRCGVPPARIAVLPLGMSPRRQTPPPKEKSETEPPLLLCFGFLHPDKGIETLIEAARQLRDAGSPPAFRVLIAGDVRARRGVFRLFGRSDRKYRDDLHRRVTSAGLDELITFSGYVGDDRLEELMASAHLVIAPYLRTTQSAAVNRAAGAGAAIVASDLPGLRASLGDAARWVPPNDPLALANALGSLLTDLGEVARLRRCALDAYEEHSMAKAAARLSHLWLSQAEITT